MHRDVCSFVFAAACTSQTSVVGRYQRCETQWEDQSVHILQPLILKGSLTSKELLRPSPRISLTTSPHLHELTFPPLPSCCPCPPQIKVASAADMVALSPADIFVHLRVLVGVSAGIFAAMHLIAGATVAWDRAHHRVIVSELKGDTLGFREHPSGAWTWSFAQEPLTADVGLLRGGAVDCARMLGCPFVRLRAAIPEDLLPGVVAESLGRRAGMAPREVERAFEAERSLVRDLRRKSKARKVTRGERDRLQKLWGSTRKAAGAAATVMAALSRKHRAPPVVGEGGRRRSVTAAAAAASLAAAMAAVRRSLPRRRSGGSSVVPAETSADMPPAGTGALCIQQPSGDSPSAFSSSASGPVSESRVAKGGARLGGQPPRLGGTHIAPAGASAQQPQQATAPPRGGTGATAAQSAALASAITRPQKLLLPQWVNSTKIAQSSGVLPTADAPEYPPQLPPRTPRSKGLLARGAHSSTLHLGPVAESAEGSGRLNGQRPGDSAAEENGPGSSQWGQRRTSPQAWGDMTGGIASDQRGAAAASERGGAAVDAVRGFFDDDESDDEQRAEEIGPRGGSRLDGAQPGLGYREELSPGGISGAARRSRVLTSRENARGAWTETPPASEQRPLSPMETEIRPFNAESSDDSSEEGGAAVHHYQPGSPAVHPPHVWGPAENDDVPPASSAAAAACGSGEVATPPQAVWPLLRVSPSSGAAAPAPVQASMPGAGATLQQSPPWNSSSSLHGDALLPAESPRSPSVLPIKARRMLLDAGSAPLAAASSSDSEGEEGAPQQQALDDRARGGGGSAAGLGSSSGGHMASVEEAAVVVAATHQSAVLVQAHSGEGAGSGSGVSSSSSAAGPPAVSRGGTAFTARWQPGSPQQFGLSGAQLAGSPRPSLLCSSSGSGSSGALAPTQASSGVADGDSPAYAVAVGVAPLPPTVVPPAPSLTRNFQAASDEDDAATRFAHSSGLGLSSTPPLRIAVALPASVRVHPRRRDDDAPRGILVNHSPHHDPADGGPPEWQSETADGGGHDVCVVGRPSEFKARKSRARSVVSKRRKVAQKSQKSGKHKVGADGGDSSGHGGQLSPRLSAWPHSPRSPRDSEGCAGSPSAQGSHRLSEASNGGRSARSSRRCSAISPRSSAADDGLDSDELEELEEDRAAAQELTSSALVFAFLKSSRVMPAARPPRSLPHSPAG